MITSGPLTDVGNRDQARSAAFRANRLTLTVFRIEEFNDIYGERPFIYAKVFPKFILLLDTGCGGATKKGDVDVTSLREFIETWPIGDNNNLPLNPRGQKKYLVVCSHCHYDHIRSSCIIFSRTVINILPSGGRTFREGFTDLPIIARQRISQTRALGNVLTL